MEIGQNQAVADISSAAKAQVVCVLGMHRSGTSVITKAANLLGVYLGPDEHLMGPAKENNPKGFWEHELLTDLNDEILSALGGNWHEPPVFAPGWESAPELADLRRRAAELLAGEFASAELWGWKDPRTCLTLPFWQQLLPSMQYVICIRNPVDVARSLERRDNFTFEKGVRLWLSHMQSALRHTGGKPRMFVFYGDFMDDWRAEVHRLAVFLGRLSIVGQPELQQTMREFVNADLQHYRTSLAGVMGEPQLAFPAKALYLTLRLHAKILDADSGHHTKTDQWIQQSLDGWGAQAAMAQAELEQLGAQPARRDQAGKLLAQLRYAELAVLRQGEVLSEKERQISEIIERCTQLEQRANRLQRLLQAQQDELDLIRSSLGWRLIDGYRRFKESLLARGSRRRQLYDAVLLALKGRRKSPAASPAQPAVQLVAPLQGLVEDLALVRHRDGLHVRVRGWCWSGNNEPPPEVQVVYQGEVLSAGQPGNARADVAARLQLTQDAVTGFDFVSARALPPAARGRLLILGVVNGRDVLLKEASLEKIPVARQMPFPMSRSIESCKIHAPKGGSSPFLRISGWLLIRGPAGPTELEVRFDGTSVLRALADIERPDVAEAHRASELPEPTSLPFCGFNLSVPLDKDARRIQLVALTERGEQTVLERRVSAIPIIHEAETAIARQPRTRAYLHLAGFVARKGARKIFTREVLSPLNWRMWLGQLAEKHARVRSTDDPSSHAPGTRRPAYDTYVENNCITPRVRDMLAHVAGAFEYRPTISILMPVYNVEPKWLVLAVESVKSQIYSHWELCIADDASTNPELLAYLRGLGADPRIKVVFRPSNGHICAAGNSAAELATGEFVAFMDNDDELEPHALFEFVRLLQERPEADVIYSDEDKIDEDGYRYSPQFKPDWSPEMLLAYNYINHFTCMRRALFERVGRFRIGYEGSQDRDLLLRVASESDRVHHTPKVLYHWRALKTSTAASAAVKPIMHTASRAALEDHLKRLGVLATPYTPEFAQQKNLPINLLDWPDTGPSVAIIVPTHNQAAQLRGCVESILDKTTYTNYRLIVVDNDSDDPKTLAYLSTLAGKGITVERISNEGRPFSFSRINNLAVQRAREDLVLFLNNDTEIVEPKWLSRMVGYLSLPGVGATGARLLYPDKTIQHAGVVLGLHGGIAPGHAFRHHPAARPSYYFQAEIVRPCAAVTGACLLTRRSQFLELGGFDEQNLSISLNDVDFCLRLAKRGLRTVYVGSAELLHHESQSRGRRDDPAEIAHFREKYRGQRDVYYNPNLSNVHSFQVDTGCHLDYESYLPRPVRALFATHNLNTEGAPKSLYELAVGLKRRGRVEPVVLSPVGGVGEKWYNDAGIAVRVHELRSCRNVLQGWPSKADYLASVEQVHQTLDDERPDVVIANTLNGFYVIEAAARAGIPAVWIIRESYNAPMQRASVNTFAWPDCERAFAHAYRVVFVSTDTMKLYERYNSRHNFVVVQNGLDARPIEQYAARVSQLEAARRIGAFAGKKLVTMVGTLCERKDQLTLVEAAAIVARRRRDFCCYLVGLRETLPYAELVRRKIGQHGLDDVVKLIPETDDVLAYYRASDIFVFTSRIEAFSRTILEAEAFGLPIVATPCAGIHEQVRRDVNALLFNMGDAAGLAQHLDTLLDDDQKRVQMGRNSRSVLDFLWSYDEMLARYERLALGAWMRRPSTESADAHAALASSPDGPRARYADAPVSRR